MKVKICGMKYRDNLQKIDNLQPDYLGFIFYNKSERYMRETLVPSDLKSISSKTVGVFVNPVLKEVEKVMIEFNLDALQFHGDESPEFCNYFKRNGTEVIKAFSVDNKFDFDTTKKYNGCCNYFLFDTKGSKKGGTGIAFDWRLIKKYDQKVSFFLSGGIGYENIQEALTLSRMNIYAIDINSKAEDSAGLKNIEKVSKIISLLRTNTK